MAQAAVPQALEAILNIARWAPSGDNAQPWRFCIRGDRDLDVFVQRANPNIYEYRDGEPTLLSAGGLLENIKLAAPAFGLKARWRFMGSAEGIDRIAVHFSDSEASPTSELLREITRRSVDRRPFKMRALTWQQKEWLAGALGEGMQVDWFESLSQRRAIAALSGLATRIRLAIPETFQVHRSIVDWENSESEHGIPSQALGLDPVTLLLTRWSMASWERTRFMNLMGAPTFASLQMDALPGLFCASYFVIRLKRYSSEPNKAFMETLEAGQSIQRFWLTASQLGLAMQPCVAVLAFWVYAATGRNFTASTMARKTAVRLSQEAEAVLGRNEEVVFLGRIGWPRGQVASRSTRLPLKQLLVG
jgi:hypothetical protein